MFRILLAIFSLLTVSVKAQISPGEMFELIRSSWKAAGEYEIPHTRSSIYLPIGAPLLIGDEAKKFGKLYYDSMGFTDYSRLENLSMTAIDFTIDTVLLSEYFEMGHIPFCEWDKLDTQKFIEEIREQYQGRFDVAPENYVFTWVQKPIVKKDTCSVHWAFEIDDGYEKMVKAVVIKLGRFGYARLTQSMEKDAFVPFNTRIDLILNLYNFEEGARYTDFSDGDKVGTIDITSLAKYV